MPALPLADEQARGGGDGAGVAIPRAFRNDARAVAAGKRCRDRIDRDDKHAGKLPDRAHRVEHILEHGRREQRDVRRGSRLTTAVAWRPRIP